MYKKENFPCWEDLLAELDKRNKLKNKITKIGASETGVPSGFKLILKGEFQEFGAKLEKIINDFLTFSDENIKVQKVEEALISKVISSKLYTFEIAETIAMQILEYVENEELAISCSIKKDINFIQI